MRRTALLLLLLTGACAPSTSNDGPTDSGAAGDAVRDDSASQDASIDVNDAARDLMPANGDTVEPPDASHPDANGERTDVETRDASLTDAEDAEA